MKLSDVVSALQLSIYAEIPLLLFLGVFVGVVAYLLGSPRDFAHASALPLRDEGPPRKDELQ